MPAIAPLATPELAGLLDTSEQPQQVSFLGTMARTADKAKLALAQRMEAQRASPTDIWNATGWFRGADTKWRFEIPDKPSKFESNPKKMLGLEYGGKLPMREVYSHPELFEAYPELGDIRFGIRKMQGALGSYTPPPKGPIIEMSPAQSVKDMRSALLHELQHGTQGIENFAKGGNPRVPAVELGLPLPRTSIAEEAGIFGPLSQRQYQNYIKNRSFNPGYEHYLRQAGEVEARNVQKRMLMTPQQLRETPPWMTQVIPNDYQFVNFKLPWEQNPASFIDESLLRTRY